MPVPHALETQSKIIRRFACLAVGGFDRSKRNRGVPCAASRRTSCVTASSAKKTPANGGMLPLQEKVLRSCVPSAFFVLRHADITAAFVLGEENRQCDGKAQDEIEPNSLTFRRPSLNSPGANIWLMFRPKRAALTLPRQYV